MFPLEKYIYYVNEEARTVVAVQTFAKKKYRGVAVCSDDDTFDVEKGKKLAALKCNKKIADARLFYAIGKAADANEVFVKASADLEKYKAYLQDSLDRAKEAFKELSNFKGEC